ncbi:hypothetical protein R83H12_00122 [Fibrobacteria bacterium R8-3-H12]
MSIAAMLCALLLFSRFFGKDSGMANYRTKRIGDQIWMAENLRYNASGSKCYDNQESNCDMYGRLYSWAMAMALPHNCNSTACASQISEKHRGICPSGWHIPSDADWTTLMDFVGGAFAAGNNLKAATNWNGTDSYDFTALPGGYGSSNGDFNGAGYNGFWWSSSEYDALSAYYRSLEYSGEYAYWDGSSKSNFFSVRCIQD